MLLTEKSVVLKQKLWNGLSAFLIITLFFAVTLGTGGHFYESRKAPLYYTNKYFLYEALK